MLTVDGAVVLMCVMTIIVVVRVVVHRCLVSMRVCVALGEVQRHARAEEERGEAYAPVELRGHEREPDGGPDEGRAGEHRRRPPAPIRR